MKIRWLIRRDLPEVLAIEQACFEWAWTEEDFIELLRQRNCIGMVADLNHEVVGFMVYELHKSKLRILNFAVAPESQRCGIGSAMVARLFDKLSQQRRKEITLEIRETNLPAQLFFVDCGFRAVRIIRGHYDDTDEDAYVFRYRSDESVPVNRVSSFCVED